MRIRPFERQDLAWVLALWNQAVRAGEVVYRPADETYFETKFFENPSYDPAYSFVAEVGGQGIGWVSGTAPKVFLDRETPENTPGYLTLILVDPAHRRKGAGSALLDALKSAFRKAGKKTIACTDRNPINLDWIIPGTPGHDHNNCPGVDVEGMGYPFLLSEDFEERFREVAMYINLADYRWDPSVDVLRQRLADEGIATGVSDPGMNYDYDGMCDRVGSEYWRSAIRTELAAWRTGQPTTDLRFLPNGKIPKGPRPLLTATHEGKIVGFTGPVDLQESGRGFFTGICTDPLYERRGIATVLFNLLMRAFIEEGAAFSTLFTGDTGHAQRLYARTGFRVAKRFAVLSAAL